MRHIPKEESQRSSKDSTVAQTVKNLPTKWETWVLFLGQEDPLGEGTATHSNILAWEIQYSCLGNPWTELGL